MKPTEIKITSIEPLHDEDNDNTTITTKDITKDEISRAISYERALLWLRLGGLTFIVGSVLFCFSMFTYRHVIGSARDTLVSIAEIGEWLIVVSVVASVLSFVYGLAVRPYFFEISDIDGVRRRPWFKVYKDDRGDAQAIRLKKSMHLFGIMSLLSLVVAVGLFVYSFRNIDSALLKYGMRFISGFPLFAAIGFRGGKIEARRKLVRRRLIRAKRAFSDAGFSDDGESDDVVTDNSAMLSNIIIQRRLMRKGRDESDHTPPGGCYHNAESTDGDSYF